MTKNKLTDLNDHLFEQLERLNNDALTPDELKLETQRAAAMSQIAHCVIDNAKIALKAHMELNGDKTAPAMLQPKAELPALRGQK